MGAGFHKAVDSISLWFRHTRYPQTEEEWRKVFLELDAEVTKALPPLYQGNSSETKGRRAASDPQDSMGKRVGEAKEARQSGSNEPVSLLSHRGDLQAGPELEVFPLQRNSGAMLPPRRFNPSLPPE